jgi:hypothetical protein
VATLSVKLPADLGDRLATAAREQGTTRSAFVRLALETALRRGGRVAPGSCFALARDLAGCVEGPRDLSTAKRHLRGYGR